MDFVVNNKVGIKADYVLMDDYNLDISFIYKYYDESVTVEQIDFTDLTIKDEDGNVLYYRATSKENIVDKPYFINASSSAEPLNLENNCIKDSLLVTSKGFPHSQTLNIEFTGFDIENADNIIHISGLWNFSIDLDNKFIYRTTSNYLVSTNEYVYDVSTTITDTALVIDLYLNTEIDTDAILFNSNENIILKDSSENIYYPLNIITDINTNFGTDYKSNLKFYFPLSIYNEINNFNLQIDLGNNKLLNLDFVKDSN